MTEINKVLERLRSELAECYVNIAQYKGWIEHEQSKIPDLEGYVRALEQTISESAAFRAQSSLDKIVGSTQKEGEDTNLCPPVQGPRTTEGKEHL